MLRQFAGVWLLAIAVVAYRFGPRIEPAVAVVLVIVAVGIGVTGLIWPVVVRPLFIALTVITLPIGWAVSTLLMVIAFYGLFTPIALWFRLLGAMLCERRFCPERDTYWEPKTTPADPCAVSANFLNRESIHANRYFHGI